jgi:hypothetical protein
LEVIDAERRWPKWFSSRGTTISRSLTSADSGIIASPRPRTKIFSMSSGVLRPDGLVCTITSYWSLSRL